jgi:hypothetical protein
MFEKVARATGPFVPPYLQVGIHLCLDFIQSLELR